MPIRNLVRPCLLGLGAALLLVPAAHAELLDIRPLQTPRIFFDAGGTLDYDAASGEIRIVASPLSIQVEPGGPLRPIDPATAPGQEVFRVAATLEPDGEIDAGVPGDDFSVVGRADLDGDGVLDVDGVLLRGESVFFGFLDAGDTDEFDFLVELTRGELVDLFGGVGAVIGVAVTSPGSSFGGDFTQDFSGGAEGTAGIVGDEPPPLEGAVGDFVWFDADRDGIQGPQEPGIEGVPLNLFGDADGDGAPEFLASTLTDAQGAYLFDDLGEGDYEVEVDPSAFDLPDGPLAPYGPTASFVGDDPELDSDGSPALTRLDTDHPEDRSLDFGFECLCKEVRAPLPRPPRWRDADGKRRVFRKLWRRWLRELRRIYREGRPVVACRLPAGKVRGLDPLCPVQPEPGDGDSDSGADSDSESDWDSD